MPEYVTIALQAGTALVAVLAFVLAITRKNDSPPVQSVDCKYQHMAISQVQGRIDANMEKTAEHIAHMCLLMEDHSRSSDLQHMEIINELRKQYSERQKS